MKRSLTLLLVISAFLASAQSFHRGAVVLDLNTGIEAYKTRLTYRGLNDLPDTAVKGLAANQHFVLGVEVGLNRFIGIGVKGKANNFFRDIDAVSRQRSDLSSTDLVLSLNIHPVSVKKFDLLIGADLGFSDLDLSFSDLDEASLSSAGIYLAPYLNPRIYFGRFGFNLRTNLPFISYSSFKSSGSGEPGNYILSAWKGSGFGVSLGIQLHLF